MLENKEREYYHRQIILDEIGELGQKRLKESKVLVIGAGGLGSPLLQGIVGAGIGNVGICDFDTVAISNLHRQNLYNYDDLDESKGELAVSLLKKRNPWCNITLFNERLTPENAEEIFSGYDIIADCCDNFSSRFVIHDMAYKLKKVLVSASIYQYEGQLHLLDFTKPSEGPCWRCLWSEVPKAPATPPGLLTSTPGVIGSLQATEILKYILNKEHLANGEMVLVDLLSISANKMRWPKSPSCPNCSK